jgi:hypothetical protein
MRSKKGEHGIVAWSSLGAVRVGEKESFARDIGHYADARLQSGTRCSRLSFMCSAGASLISFRVARITSFVRAAVRMANSKARAAAVAETEGFEPSIGLYNPITV